ncbi:ATPase histidine kinase DNA gyrase B HSP90 domain protein [Secundilactobacillus kimchicus JCM 15530]|uniref:histidine kinase n=2 Tax=Secundilactobacillus kimchicus TaxID=528209 RepID=A0A0R1HVU5_9LACO|nr:ATPase histidine kinase DNA gyrase B HSP90 domain protein [Secundilactobacillus kimchicus JCM 15530]
MSKKNQKSTPEKRQQFQLFIKELVMFAILFATLGGVVYFFFHESVYHNIDQGLQGERNRILKNTPQDAFKRDPGSRGVQPPEAAGPFRANTIVFDGNGKILNAGWLGTRNYNLLKNSTLDKTQLNKIQEVVLSSGTVTSHFRTLLIKVPTTNTNPMYRGNYVLILENVDADLLAISSFRKALLVTLVFFWILAIAVAYFLSRSSMKPIIQSWRRQRDFSANAAHELRTPLTVIQNQLEYMLTKPKDQVMTQIDEISTALGEVKHLKTLTNRLLVLARSDSGTIQINRQSVDLEPWFDGILKPYAEIATSQQKAFNPVVKLSGQGRIDTDFIRQLMVILLDNAIKYTPPTGTVTVRVTRSHDNLHLEVADTGAGIADDDKVRVFDRFYRTDQSRNSKTGGNGLGLAIAKWIVDQHRGRITVRDNHPKGAVFSVTLPIN